MSEANLWEEMRKNISHLGHFCRVESHATSEGIPDVDFCVNSNDGHIELKYGIDRDWFPEIRPSQIRWFKNRTKHKGNSFLFAKIEESGTVPLYVLFLGRDVKILARNRDKWRDIESYMWYDKMDWARFLQLISPMVFPGEIKGCPF